MIQFLKHTYALSLTTITAGAGPDFVLDQMKSPELVTLHNLVASNLDRRPVKKFSDNATAVKRTWAILQDYQAVVDAEAKGEVFDDTAPPAPPAPKPVAERKKRGMRFVFPAEAEVKPIRADSARGKALSVLSQKGGGTFADVQKATGWSEKQAYEGIRLLHYYSGYGLAEEVRDGQTYIKVHTGKK